MRKKYTNFFLGLSLLGLCSFASAHANTFDLQLDGHRYTLEQFERNDADRAFYRAWDCWIQRAQHLTLEGSDFYAPTGFVLDVGDHCRVAGVSQLRFTLDDSAQGDSRVLHFVLTEPQFSNSPLARETHTRLAATIVRKHPRRDGIASVSFVPELTLNVRIQHLEDGNPSHRGVSVNLNSAASWSVTHTELISSELDGKHCYPPVPSTCDNYIDTYERVWTHSISGETFITHFRVKRN